MTDRPAPPRLVPIYAQMAPADHTGVCWASAIGRARGGVAGYSDEATRAAALLALEMLTDGRAECRCDMGRARRRRGR